MGDRSGVPWVIVQIPVVVLAQDVVDPERPRAPPERRLVRLPAVRVEQPPAAHVHLGAVGGHDVLVRGELGAGDEPVGDCRARDYLGEDSPEDVQHGWRPMPGHARCNKLMFNRIYRKFRCS